MILSNAQVPLELFCFLDHLNDIYTGIAGAGSRCLQQHEYQLSVNATLKSALTCLLSALRLIVDNAKQF